MQNKKTSIKAQTWYEVTSTIKMATRASLAKSIEDCHICSYLHLFTKHNFLFELTEAKSLWSCFISLYHSGMWCNHWHSANLMDLLVDYLWSPTWLPDRLSLECNIIPMFTANFWNWSTSAYILWQCKSLYSNWLLYFKIYSVTNIILQHVQIYQIMYTCDVKINVQYHNCTILPYHSSRPSIPKWKPKW